MCVQVSIYKCLNLYNIWTLHLYKYTQIYVLLHYSVKNIFLSVLELLISGMFQHTTLFYVLLRPASTSSISTHLASCFHARFLNNTSTSGALSQCKQTVNQSWPSFEGKQSFWQMWGDSNGKSIIDGIEEDSPTNLWGDRRGQMTNCTSCSADRGRNDLGRAFYANRSSLLTPWL